MSETRQTFLALMEEDPELKPLAPVMRVLLLTPSRSLAPFLSLANLWAGLPYEQRALLVLWLMGTLPIQQVADLTGVHRRTLYKSDLVKDALKRKRDEAIGEPPRGDESDDDDPDFDPWAAA